MEPGGGGRGGGKGPPGTSSRGGCLHSSSRWPRADVICSKSSRSRPGSWRDEVCGQWSGQGCESRGWGTLRARLKLWKGKTLQPTSPTHSLPPPNPHLVRIGEQDSFHFQCGGIYLFEVHKSGLCLVSCLRWSQGFRSYGSKAVLVPTVPSWEIVTCLSFGLADLGRHTVFTDIYQLRLKNTSEMQNLNLYCSGFGPYSASPNEENVLALWCS